MRVSSLLGDHRKSYGRTIMISNNKIVSLAVIGIVLGGIVGTVVNSAQVNMVSAAILGGIVGFLAGWIWNTRSGESKD